MLKLHYAPNSRASRIAGVGKLSIKYTKYSSFNLARESQAESLKGSAGFGPVADASISQKLYVKSTKNDQRSAKRKVSGSGRLGSPGSG